MLKENYELVDQKITEACKRAGRDRKDVTLIAVSKTKPLSDIEELLAETEVYRFLARTKYRNWLISMKPFPAK